MNSRLKLKTANDLKSLLGVTRENYMKKTNYPDKRYHQKTLTCSFGGIILTGNYKNLS